MEKSLIIVLEVLQTEVFRKMFYLYFTWPLKNKTGLHEKPGIPCSGDRT